MENLPRNDIVIGTQEIKRGQQQPFNESQCKTSYHDHIKSHKNPDHFSSKIFTR